ncbi:MAG: nuclear transport factor 2 family protein [Gammaproteobacteria bacterium]|nr:nuclear transport factor 2 family protein [Gammaproteobacteria bacterium]
MLRTALVASALSLLSVTAFATASDDANSHFKAIASGQMQGIMAGYSTDAELQWVGGPLDGSYKGMESIQDVWAKFTKSNSVLQVSVDKLAESANPKGATVTANVTFTGKNTIKVRYVLTYREGKLVNEVWQIDPKLGMSY